MSFSGATLGNAGSKVTKMMNMDDYNQAGIRSLLATKWAGNRLLFYDVTDSTNLQAREEAEDGAPHGTMIVADRQTAGRGRRGRSWESPAGVNVYFSLVMRPDVVPDKASMLTLIMAHSVCRVIALRTGLDCKIKWPNDVVVNGRKVCGILTEMGLRKDGSFYLVVGVGINVRSQEFAPELSGKATSLEDEIGRRSTAALCKVTDSLEGDLAVSRSLLLAEIMGAFEEDYEIFLSRQNLSGLLDSYNHMLINKDAKVRVLDPRGEYDGKALGITETGELLVETADGTVEQVYAGEVSVRGIYGYV